MLHLKNAILPTMGDLRKNAKRAVEALGVISEEFSQIDCVNNCKEMEGTIEENQAKNEGTQSPREGKSEH
jgi:hypothetical protein